MLKSLNFTLSQIHPKEINSQVKHTWKILVHFQFFQFGVLIFHHSYRGYISRYPNLWGFIRWLYSRNLWPAPLAPLLQALVEQRVEMNKRCLEKLKASHPKKSTYG